VIRFGGCKKWFAAAKLEKSRHSRGATAADRRNGGSKKTTGGVGVDARSAPWNRAA
jgi:hypothetical protein